MPSDHEVPIVFFVAVVFCIACMAALIWAVLYVGLDMIRIIAQ